MSKPKSPKQLLITQSKWTHVFHLGPEFQIRPIVFTKYQEMTLSPTHTPSCFFDFPGELILKILVISFFDLLYSKNFEDAFDLLLVSRKLLAEIYLLIYGPSVHTITDKARHMHASLFLVEILHDDYLCTVNINKDSRMGVKFETCHPTRNVAPWDLYPEILFARHSRIIDKDGPANPYLTGPYFGDVVTIYGTSIDGIVNVQQMHHPVFTLMITSRDGVLIPDEGDFWHNRAFKKFANLLKIIYGKRTGVYFMVKPYGNENNPFVTASDTYFKFR